MKKIKLMGTVVLLSLMALVFTGCDWITSVTAVLAAPQGYVYDGRTGDPIEGATVTLTGSTTKTATTSSTGYYTFTDVDYGTFELTATSTDYVFTKQMVEVSGLAQYLPNVAGLAKDLNIDGTDEDILVPGILSILVFWDRDFRDVDAHLTFPTTDVGAATFADAEEDFYNLTTADPIDTNGFLPTAAGSDYRTHLNYSNDVFPSGSNPINQGDIWLDVDNVGYWELVTDGGLKIQPKGGPETFTIFYSPYDLSLYDPMNSYLSVEDDPSKLPAGNYSCVGVMEYYLDAYNATIAPINDNGDLPLGSTLGTPLLSSSDNSGTANPVVYVFDGENQIARYTLPEYTDIERASIFRINILVNESGTTYYQILPDLRVLVDDGFTYGNIRSLQTETSPIIVKARSRR